jgi:hypothetical protein
VKLIAKFVLAAAAFSSLNAFAQRKLSIQSTHDRYDVVIKSKTSGTVGGKPTDLAAMADLWPVVDNPVGNVCPDLKGPPDITVKENGKTRFIYVKQGVVKSEDACLNVGGDGLFFFPIHRDFLIGAKRSSIKLASPVKIFRQGVKLVELQKDAEGRWQNENKEQLLNWDFIERFENSLRDFDVRLRVHPDIAAGKPKLLLQTGNQTYEFFKVTKVMWAVKKPGYNWLVASNDWSFWFDFDQSLIEDRWANEIRLLQKPGVPAEERKAAMDKLEGAWSRNLRDLYHKFLLDPDEDPSFQETAIQRLKRKPSLETSGVMVQFLNTSHNEDLKRIAGQILKIYYPKGPLYKPTLNAGQKAKVMEFWNNWWKQNQKGG